MIKETTIDSKEGQKIKYGASTLSDLPDNQCSRSVKINKKNGHVAIATNDGGIHIRESLDNLDKHVADF